MIRPVINLIKALQSNVSPGEIAAGAAMGVFFGFTPMNRTHVIFLVLAFFLFRINRAACVLTIPLYKLAYYLGVVNLADGLGNYLLLRADFLTPFWTWITNAPVLAYLELNHTLVLGGLIISLLLSLPVYVLCVQLVLEYRARLRTKMANWKVVQWAQKLTLVRWAASWWPKEPAE